MDTQKVCQHKPGEQWTDGCCTSKRRNHENLVEDNNNIGIPILKKSDSVKM
jgi:hypothetical protein